MKISKGLVSLENEDFEAKNGGECLENYFPDFNWVTLRWSMLIFRGVISQTRDFWMILEQNYRAQNFISICFGKKGESSQSTLWKECLKFSAPSAFLESPASSVGVVGSSVIQLHGWVIQLHSWVDRYVLNCTPVRSNGGVSNFYEKDRQTGRSVRWGALTQANDGWIKTMKVIQKSDQNLLMD